MASHRLSDYYKYSTVPFKRDTLGKNKCVKETDGKARREERSFNSWFSSALRRMDHALGNADD